MNSIAGANNAMIAIRNYLNRRAGVSPAVHREAWTKRTQLYKKMDGLGKNAARRLWAGVTPEQPRTELDYLPTVKHRCTNSTWTFLINGEIAFRDVPEHLAASAKLAGRIEVEIDSVGGCGLWALELGERVRALDVPVVITANRAYSAAAILLQFGTVRRIRTGGSLMLHAPQAAVLGGAADLETVAGYLRSSLATITDFLCATTGQPREVVESWHRADTYFNAEQALAAGLVDEIVPDVTNDFGLVVGSVPVGGVETVGRVPRRGFNLK